MNSSPGSGPGWLEDSSVVVPTGRSVLGEVRPPSSKSVSHRVMNLAMLLGRPVRVHHLLAAEDLDLFQAAFSACGWLVSGSSELLYLAPAAAGWRPPDGSISIDCGNAGTMFRFLVASRCVCSGVTLIDGSERLRERPIGPLVDALRSLGAKIEFLGSDGYAPLRVQGGSLRGGRAVLDAGQSSQYLSALLMACCLAKEETEIEVEALVSTPYVDVTMAAIRRFGLHPPQVRGQRWSVASRASASRQPADGFELEIEADFSAAAYPAAAAMISGGSVRITGLDPDSAQGDRRFLDVLVEAGGQSTWCGSELRFCGRPRHALDVDLGDMPDQVPTLAAVAAFCPGTTRIRNVAHLRIKESDRLRAVALEWSKIGIPVKETGDGLEIEGRPQWLDHPPNVLPSKVETHDDHRIAMSAALVGLRRPLVINEPRVVAKSYPNFWSDLFRLLGSPSESVAPRLDSAS